MFVFILLCLCDSTSDFSNVLKHVHPNTLCLSFTHTYKYCDLQNKWKSLRRSFSGKLAQISRWNPLEIPFYFASRSMYALKLGDYCHANNQPVIQIKFWTILFFSQRTCTHTHVYQFPVLISPISAHIHTYIRHTHVYEYAIWFRTINALQIAEMGLDRVKLAERSAISYLEQVYIYIYINVSVTRSAICRKQIGCLCGLCHAHWCLFIIFHAERVCFFSHTT